MSNWENIAQTPMLGVKEIDFKFLISVTVQYSGMITDILTINCQLTDLHRATNLKTGVLFRTPTSLVMNFGIQEGCV